SPRPRAARPLDRPLPRLLAEAHREAEGRSEGNGAMTHEAEPNDATESVVLECDLPEPPAKVWKALTEPALLAAWLLPNDIRPEIGARFTFQADAEAGGGTIECEVLDVDAPRLLRYSWRAADADRDASDRALDSVVTFVLAETADGGTRFR